MRFSRDAFPSRDPLQERAGARTQTTVELVQRAALHYVQRPSSFNRAPAIIFGFTKLPSQREIRTANSYVTEQSWRVGCVDWSSRSPYGCVALPWFATACIAALIVFSSPK